MNTTLPALKSLSDLADMQPVVIVDTREQEPLPLRRFPAIRAFDGIGWYFEVAATWQETEKAKDWIASLAAVDVLFLDDAFRGRLSDAQELAMLGVVERRTSNGMPIIMTLNQTGKSLLDAHGERIEPIIRRLKEFCDDVSF